MRKDPYSLDYVADWFLMEEQVNIWHYNDSGFDDDELEGYKKCKALKTLMI